MNSRKFTDSEIRAYARNRHEEKNLRTRLQKLKQEFGEFHDTTVKHRSSLIEECRQMRKTSGGTPSSRSTAESEDNEFELFSNRVSRPWAYSVMETTYNVLYQEAIIPTPKRVGSKSVSQSSKSVNSERVDANPSRSGMLSSRPSYTRNSLPIPLMPQKANTSPALFSNRYNLAVGKSCKKETSLVKAHVSDANCQNTFTGNETELTDKLSLSLSVIESSAKQTSVNNDEQFLKPILSTVNGVNKTNNENSESESSVLVSNNNNEANIGEKYTGVNYTEDKREYNTKYISLPAVYKIDSEENQTSVRQQMVQRARSRNEPPTQKLKPPSREGIGNRMKPENTQTTSESVAMSKSISGENERDHSVTEPAVENSKPDIVDVSVKNSKDKELNLLKEMDSGLSEALFVKATDLVTYRGKTIHNYIRPEERYKLDPLILKRRQNRMDKLAKESATFLKRVNHENIRVEIAFPRSTRKRLLTRLVDENNFGKGRKIKNGGEIFIQNKVEEFIVSISDYIVKQRVQ